MLSPYSLWPLRRPILFSLIGLLLLSPSIPASPDLLTQGVSLLEQGRNAEARVLFQQSADKGEPAGQYGLGVLYYQGLGVTRDYRKSVAWFTKAARQGSSAAQYNLGNAYLHGQGVDKSPVKAEQWWRKAASQDYPKAQFNLGSMLISRATDANTFEEGIAWYRASAENGFSPALDKLHDIDEPVDFDKIDLDPEREPARSEARLLTQNPESFLIQMFSGQQAGSAQRFIAQYGLTHHALLFRFKGRGGIWTGVVYGEYANREEARQIIKGLKPELRKLGPWIRRVKEIQELIRKARR